MHLGPTLTAEVFRGIPHAKPPVGPLRFKKPEPPLPWSDVKNVANDRTACAQSAQPRNNDESEDCLYLDVYRPSGANSSALLPVMVWIHGGGYAHGSKNGNGAVLASNGVIEVSINYRLGPLGFLSTEDSSMPGNYGMLDQISALKWIQSNIRAFGGDPDRVTIFGASAGGASCSHLIMSPLATGLFKRAIMESGAATASRDATPPMVAVTPKDIALNAGKELGCTQGPGQAFVSCMQSKPVADVIRTTLKAAQPDESTGTFRPRVEHEFGFLPDYPINLVARGEFNHVDMMRGFDAQELGRMIRDQNNNGLTIAEFKDYASKQLVDFPYLDKDVFGKRVLDVYVGNETDPLKIREAAVDMVSDFTFISPIVLEAQAMAKKNQGHKNYLYKFDYRSSFATTPDWVGVNHGAEVAFVFGLRRPDATDEDKKVSEMTLTMWINFAKYGDPTPWGKIHAPLIHWDQFFGGRPMYMEIDSPLELKAYNTTANVNRLNLFKDTQKKYVDAIVNSNNPVVG